MLFYITLAATRHTLLVEDSPRKVCAKDIIATAKAGRVPVHLVSSSLSQNAQSILTMCSLFQIVLKRTPSRFYPIMPLCSRSSRFFPEGPIEVCTFIWFYV